MLGSLGAVTDGAPSWRVGDVFVTRIDETSFRLPIAEFIPGATPAVRAEHAPKLSADQLDAAGSMCLVIGAFVVESRGRRILVDTCLGSESQHGVENSPFLHRLKAAGFPPRSIDAVVCTHMHLDHVGWNTTVIGGERMQTFPRADYLFCATEWSAMRDADPDEVLYSLIATDVAWLIDAERATLVEPTYRLTDEVSLLPTFGHSPGHVAVLIESGGHHAVITGDSAHHPIQLLEPSLASMADGDAPLAERSRLGLIDRAIETKATLFGTHFAVPSAVILRDRADGLELDAVEPATTSAGSSAPWA